MNERALGTRDSALRVVSVELADWQQACKVAEAIRFEVFVVEQKVPAELELDSWDPLCVHAIAYDASHHAVGTGRLLPDGHIGRMAVLRSARGSGVGSALLRCLMEEARRRGHLEARLAAQTHAVPFYARHGYRIVSAEYVDAGIPHVDMTCAL